MGKPVGSRTDFLGGWKVQFRTVNFVQETCLPFAQISSFDRKTAVKAWNWYQKWLWRNGTLLSVGNSPSGKDRTTFSDVPLLPEIFHWIDTKIRVHLHPDRNSRNLLVQNECWWKAPVTLRLLSNRIEQAFCKIVNNPCWSLLYELIVKAVTVVFFLLVALSFSNGWSAFLLSNPHGPWWLA